MAGQSGGGGSRANYKKARLAESLAASAKQGSALKDERANMRNAASKSSNNSPTKNKVAPYMDPYDRFASNRKTVLYEGVQNRAKKSRGESTNYSTASGFLQSYIDPKTKVQRGE